MEVYDSVTIELDTALAEHAEASALVAACKARLNKFDRLKKQKKKGFTKEGRKSAVKELDEAKAQAKVTKGRVDELEARKEAEVRANDLAEKSSAQQTKDRVDELQAKKGAEVGANGLVEKSSTHHKVQTSASGDSVNGESVSARPSTRPSENADGSSSTPTGDPDKGGNKPQAEQREGSHPQLTARKSGDADGEEEHSDVAESDGDQDGEEARSDVAENDGNSENRETSQDEAENNGDQDRAKSGDQNGPLPGELNTKRRKHKVEDDEATDNEEDTGEGPRKRSKKKEKEAKLDERKILSDVNKYIQRPYTSRLKVATRSAVRTHQALAPAVGTTFKTLAMEVLKTNRGNVLCPYHQEMDKRGVTDTLNIGVPRSRSVVGKKSQANSEEHRERLEQGFLHCGCPISAGLWDFYFWKSFKLTVNIKDDNGVTECITERVPRWTPKDRAFFYRIWKKYTFLKVEDLYTKDMSPEKHEEEMLTEQAHRILDRVNELRTKRGGKTLGIYDEDPLEEGDLPLEPSSGI